MPSVFISPFQGPYIDDVQTGLEAGLARWTREIPLLVNNGIIQAFALCKLQTVLCLVNYTVIRLLTVL